MEIEALEKKNRIKLKVTTNTGLNLLCTANRGQRVRELLPHIANIYEEVKEDQGFEDSLKQHKIFVKTIQK